MPIHDFQCAACGHRFEELVKVGATAACPRCGAGETKRLDTFSAAVSTEGSRKRAFAGARQKADAMKKEQDHAHQAYIRQHMKDHD